MSVQISDGPIHVSADDFQATDSGIQYAIKLRELQQLGETWAMILEKIDGDWISAKVIDSNVPAGIVKAGGPQAYAENIIRPAVKAWLAQRKLQQLTPAQEVAGIVGKWVAL